MACQRVKEDSRAFFASRQSHSLEDNQARCPEGFDILRAEERPPRPAGPTQHGTERQHELIVAELTVGPARQRRSHLRATRRPGQEVNSARAIVRAPKLPAPTSDQPAPTSAAICSSFPTVLNSALTCPTCRRDLPLVQEVPSDDRHPGSRSLAARDGGRPRWPIGVRTEDAEVTRLRSSAVDRSPGSRSRTGSGQWATVRPPRIGRRGR